MKKMHRKAVISAAALGALLATTPLAYAGPNDIPSQGGGYSALATEVDKLVKALMDANKLPGMTVAVTKKDKLVFSKGYGYANLATKQQMSPSTRTLIGSTTKAAVTGPTAWKALAANPTFDRNSRVYGTGAIFGTAFDADRAFGTKRLTPIVGIAIDSASRVHAWYTDGTYSIGSSDRLDRYQAPKPYKPAWGKAPKDIREIAFMPDGTGKDYVVTWYDDKTFSFGRPFDLGVDNSTFNITEPIKAKLPSGYGMEDVVAIDINRVPNGSFSSETLAWFDDGRVSRGAPGSLAAKSAPALLKNVNSAKITRAAAVAPNGVVYYWLSSGQATKGTYLDPTSSHKGYAYTTAAVTQPDWNTWYRSITAQHLLDHKAGFIHSGDVAGAAKYFGKDEAALTYDEAHRYILRTRKLQFAPGTDGSYSNHGMGLWTSLVPRLTGSTFRDYARTAHLTPLGLQNRIVPQGASHPDSTDAVNYEFSDGKAVAQPDEAVGLGAAAGGYRAAAADLAKVMVGLRTKHSWADIDRMGWLNDKGVLWHNGKTGGGVSHVMMFPDGYVSGSGVDLSDVTVAVTANATGDPWPNDPKEFTMAQLASLASNIAVAAGKTAIPFSYNLWGNVKTG